MQVLYTALGTKYGIHIRCNNPQKARQELIKAREESKDSELAKIQIYLSPEKPDEEVWVLPPMEQNYAEN